MPKKSVKAILSFLLITNVAVASWLMLVSSAFVDLPKNSTLLPAENAKPFSQLAAKYKVTKVTDIHNGETISLSRFPRFFADTLLRGAESEASLSELLLLDEKDKVLLLQSALPKVSEAMIFDFESLSFVQAAEANQLGELFFEPDFDKNQILFSQEANQRKLDTIINDYVPQKEVLITVIDSGIDNSHPAFYGSIWQNEAEISGFTNIDDDGNGLTDDINGWNFAENSGNIFDEFGHGTHVTGIIAAKKTRLANMAGVNPTGTKLMILKVASKDKSLKLSNVLSALQFASDKKSDIVNMSFGFPKESKILHSAIKKLAARGTFVVAAAGNNAENKKQYPAAYDEVLSVGSANVGGGRYKTSNFGDWVDISVPGKLLSTLPNNRYGTKSGTSQAAALVTGILSASLARQPSLSQVEGMQIVQDFAANFESDAFLKIQKKQEPQWAKTATAILKQGRFPNIRQQQNLGLHKVITFDEAIAMLLDYYELKPEALAALRAATTPIAAEDVSPHELIRSVIKPQTADEKGRYLSEVELNALLMSLKQGIAAKSDINRINAQVTGKNPYVSREKFLDMVFQTLPK